MSWLTRYRLSDFFRSSNWLSSLTGAILGLLLAPLARYLDRHYSWNLFNFDVSGAQAILGVLSGAMLTFILFLFTMLLLALQLAASQLTPRVIASLFSQRPTRFSAGIFLFTFIFSIAVLSRIQEPVPQLSVSLAVVFSLASIGTFLFLVDFSAKSLRPISVMARIAESGLRSIRLVYPLFLEGSSLPVPSRQLVADKPFKRVEYPGKSGVLLAFDSEGLMRLAQRYQGIIELIPQVGDSVSKGATLFHLYDGAQNIPLRLLKRAVAVGVERTIMQDPAFALRMIVDISIRALSPAINDPTTAVLGLDQIQSMLLELGKRRLRDEGIYDSVGELRMLIPTSNWEDFVSLGVREIRWYGADSFQINRRLRAMLQDLMKRLPEERKTALNTELQLLNRSMEENFPQPEDRALAQEPDLQGFGGVARQ